MSTAGRCSASRSSKRHEALRQVLRPGDEVVAVPAIATEGRALWDAVVAQGVAGVLARQRSSPYLPGVRSRLWRFIAAAPGSRHGTEEPAEDEPSRPAAAPVLALIERLPLDLRTTNPGLGAVPGGYYACLEAMKRRRIGQDAARIGQTRRCRGSGYRKTRGLPARRRGHELAKARALPIQQHARGIDPDRRHGHGRDREDEQASDSATSHGGTWPTISRASIANGLNGGMSDISRAIRPAPPVSRIGSAPRYPAIASRLSGSDSVCRSSGRLTNEPTAA